MILCFQKCVVCLFMFFSEAAVFPGGKEQRDFCPASENQRAGRQSVCQQHPGQPSKEKKDLICLEANELLTCQWMCMIPIEHSEISNLTYLTGHLLGACAV